MSILKSDVGAEVAEDVVGASGLRRYDGARVGVGHGARVKVRQLLRVRPGNGAGARFNESRGLLDST